MASRPSISTTRAANRGSHVLYVSEKIKNSLRERAGQYVKLDVTRMVQVMNPGDAMIQQITLAENAPGFGHVPARMPLLRDLELTAAMVVGSPNRPTIKTTLRSKRRIQLNLAGVSPLLFTRAPAQDLMPVTDGPSIELGLEILFTYIGDDGKPRPNANGNSWRCRLVAANHALTQNFELRPNAPLQMTFELNIPPGEYQFLIGYQTGSGHGGPVLSSNSVCFSIETRKRPARRPTRFARIFW